MPVSRKDVELMVAMTPNFRERWEAFLRDWEADEVPPWFVGISELAHYVVESYAKGLTVEFPELFNTVETLLQDPDLELENLISVGLFEDIQNIASHRAFGDKPFRQWLGPRSLIVWDEVDAHMQKVAAWEERQRPQWWQFWRRRKVVDGEAKLSQVESPELRRIIESNYRNKK